MNRSVSINAAPEERPDLLAAATGKRSLGRMERFQIRFIRKTFDPGWIDSSIRWCQRTLGATWIHHATRNVCHLHGLENLPELDRRQSYICVANHRTFFDMYVIMAQLMRRQLPQRIVFPVRANFFYQTLPGFLLNGLMSFFAMYPPIFRDRRLAPLNVVSLDELAWLLRRGGVFLGLHPEGTRKKDDDPYTFLEPRRGVGKLIHEARVPVLPVFVNGLANDFGKQLAANFSGKGKPVIIVFGRPLELSDLLDEASSPRVHRAVTERVMQAIGELGQRERELRAALQRDGA